MKPYVKAAASALKWALVLSTAIIVGPLLFGLATGTGISGELMAKKVVNAIGLFIIVFIGLWLWGIFTKKDPTNLLFNSSAQSRGPTNTPLSWKSLIIESFSWKSFIAAFVIAALLHGFASAAFGKDPARNILWTATWIYLTIEAWKYWKWKALLPYSIYFLAVFITVWIMASVGVDYRGLTDVIVRGALSIGGLIIFGWLLWREAQKKATYPIPDEYGDHAGGKALGEDAVVEKIRREAEERTAEEARRRAANPIPKETKLNPTTVKQDKAELEKSVDRYVSELQGRGIVNVQNVAPSGSLPKAGVKSVDKSLSSDEAFYETAINEFESTDRKVGLWAKVFAEAQGNESLAKAHYLKIRAEQLANEDKQAPLAEERQRQEKEKTAAMESTRISDSPSVDQSLSVSGAKETGRDGRFIAYDNGTVVDTITNLMWAVKDNGNEINWANAKSYCENYRGGGYTDWRMPRPDELVALHDGAKTYMSDCGYDVHLTELIRLTSTALWTSETFGSDAAIFNFYYGERYLHPQSLGTLSRALPVRSGR